jgi:chromosomal replication initiation ATPase DnaA
MRITPILKFTTYLKDKHNIIISKAIIDGYFKPIGKKNPYLKNDPYSAKITKIVSRFFNVEYKKVIGRSNKKIYSIPRQIAMYFIDINCWISHETIGKEFSNRNHSTVTTSIKTVKNFIDTDKKYADDIKELEKRIK